MSPVAALWAYDGFALALEILGDILEGCGQGHSCGIYTSRRERADLLASNTKVGRVMVNQSTALGNSGSPRNGMPPTSILTTGTWGGCLTTDNVTWRHLLNLTLASEPIRREDIDPEHLFGRAVTREAGPAVDALR